MDGIEVPRHVAESAGMPADLDSSHVGPYRFPPPRRRLAAVGAYALTALLAALLLPAGRWWAVGILAGLAVWNALASWPLGIDEVQALRIAAPAAPFPLGQVSAALTFHGWRGRPRWHVLMYDAASPPRRRAMVAVDAVDGGLAAPVYEETLADRSAIGT